MKGWRDTDHGKVSDASGSGRWYNAVAVTGNENETKSEGKETGRVGGETMRGRGKMRVVWSVLECWCVGVGGRVRVTKLEGGRES